MNFIEALTELKNGAKLRRRVWTDDVIIEINEGMLILRRSLIDHFNPIAEDILAEDWEIKE